MAAPWLKYQQQAAPSDGPWAKYAAQDQPAAPPPTLAERYAAAGIDPNEADGTGTDGENFLAGIGKSFVDTGHGLVQAGTDAARYFVESNPLLFGEHGADGLKAKVLQQQAEEAERRRRDASLMDTKAGLAGNVAGTAAQVLTPGIALRGTAGAAMLLPRTVAGNAAQGAVLGAVQPVTHEGERQANIGIGTAAGTAGAGAPKLASIAARGVKNAALATTARGAQQKAVRVIQQEAANAGRLLTPNPSLVPGASRSLFEESLDPGVAALETRSRGQGGGWSARDSANNAARSRVIEDIAGDDASMAAAETTRSAVTNGLRDAAFKEGDKAIAAAARAGFSPAENMFNVKQQIDAMVKAHGGRSSVQRALEDVIKELDGAEPSVRGLYNVRKSINDLIEGKAGSEKSYAKAATRELMQARDLVDEEMQNLAPSFGDYLASYKNLSKPINRMETGRTLLDSGSGAIPDPDTGAYRLTPGVFGRQVKNLDAVAQRATGFKKATAADVLTPADLAGVHAVNDDLARQAQRLLVGNGGGSHTASQADLGKRVIARSIIRMVPGFKAASEYLEQAGARRLSGALEEVLSDPNKYRVIAMHLSQADRRLLEQSLVRIGGVGTNIATPALAE
jgi:hypothetical protein